MVASGSDAERNCVQCAAGVHATGATHRMKQTTLAVGGLGKRNATPLGRRFDELNAANPCCPAQAPIEPRLYRLAVNPLCRFWLRVTDKAAA